MEVRSLCIKCDHKEFDFYQEFTNGKEERRWTGMSKRTGSVTGEKVADFKAQVCQSQEEAAAKAVKRSRAAEKPYVFKKGAMRHKLNSIPR